MEVQMIKGKVKYSVWPRKAVKYIANVLMLFNLIILAIIYLTFTNKETCSKSTVKTPHQQTNVFQVDIMRPE